MPFPSVAAVFFTAVGLLNTVDFKRVSSSLEECSASSSPPLFLLLVSKRERCCREEEEPLPASELLLGSFLSIKRRDLRALN
jgi:hypothetical protein